MYRDFIEKTLFSSKYFLTCTADYYISITDLGKIVIYLNIYEEGRAKRKIGKSENLRMSFQHISLLLEATSYAFIPDCLGSVK